MEKTMEYALNEALRQGRHSAMPVFIETELREKLKQRIEQGQLFTEGYLNAKKLQKLSVLYVKRNFQIMSTHVGC